MNNHGFVRVAAATPSVKVADCNYNTEEILKLIQDADSQCVEAIVFPEMCITSYTCGDLFNQQLLLGKAKKSLQKICDETKDSSIIIVVGLPLELDNRLYNVAAVLCHGYVYGIVPKTFLPNYNEFYDKRWYSSVRELRQSSINICNFNVPIGTNLIFEANNFKFAIEICEDLWAPLPPSSIHSLYGAELIFNLSASNETAGKHNYRQTLIRQQSARCINGYVYAAAGNGESTTDIVFSGSSMIAENGEILSKAERFLLESQFITADIDVDRLKNDRLKNKSFSITEYKFLDELKYQYISVNNSLLKDKKSSLFAKGKSEEKDYSNFKLNRYIDPTPFVPADSMCNERCNEIFAIQIAGLAKRLHHTNINSVVIGVSGGLDSTLALLVTVRAFDRLNIPRQNIYGITMPGFGTTGRTYNNAVELMKSLGITIKEISINEAVIKHFEDIGHDINNHDITYENSQARERTQILMDYANQINALVIGTGDLSELALGWCTYNGDHMSMYGVNTGVPKTLVKTLVKWAADNQVDTSSQTILYDVIDTPVSPELLPADDHGDIAQKTEDVVGPYLLHDFFLYYVLRFGFSPVKIYYLAQYAFEKEFSKEVILKWLKIFFRRFFTQQFKRSCLPDGPKIGSVNLSPRGDWRMPSDASMNLWMEDIESL